MAKVGLESFLLNCHTNDNLSEIEAIYGIKGFAVIVRLWQKIYSEKGYYCEWTERSPLLFLANWFGGNSGVDINLIKEVVTTALQNGLFNESLYDRYHILTSDGIQKRYFDVAKRRKEIEVIEEYLLVSIDNLGVNVNISKENVNIFNQNASKISTRKGKESKGNINNNIMCKADALTLFEQLWKLYPNKKGKGQVSDKDKQKLLVIGLEEMTRAINRYKSELEKDKEWRKPQNGSTFFHSGYVDYLDANFEESKLPAKKGGFNNFQQNDYDFNELERELLSN